MKINDIFFAAACVSIIFAAGCGDSEEQSGETVTAAPKPAQSTAAEREDGAPMNCFKNFRKSVIENDTAALLAAVDGELLQNFKQHGISNSFRKSIIAVRAAYEDLYVRRTDPREALVCAFFDREGKEQRIDVKIRLNENKTYKIMEISTAPHTPEPYLEQFFNICAAGDRQSFTSVVTPGFLEQYAEIPAGLKTQADNRINFSGNITGDRVEIPVNRSGLMGKVSMEKAKYIWKVSGIDAAFAAPMPSSAVKEFCAAVSAKQADNLAKFATAEFVEKEKPTESETLVSRLASVKIASERISGASASVSASFDNEKESGEAAFTLASSSDAGWQVADVQFSDIVQKSAPAADGGGAAAAE